LGFDFGPLGAQRAPRRSKIEPHKNRTSPMDTRKIRVATTCGPLMTNPVWGTPSASLRPTSILALEAIWCFYVQCGRDLTNITGRHLGMVWAASGLTSKLLGARRAPHCSKFGVEEAQTTPRVTQDEKKTSGLLVPKPTGRGGPLRHPSKWSASIVVSDVH
jgi:hypothetical protein